MSDIIAINLEEKSLITLPEIQAEKQQALADLLTSNVFKPQNNVMQAGPYHLHLSIIHNRTLVLMLHDKDNAQHLGSINLSLTHFSKIIRDYFQMFESYSLAVKSHSVAKIETIDMARRGIHNEGAEILLQTLATKDIISDIDTSRKLFTLICVLHFRQKARA